MDTLIYVFVLLLVTAATACTVYTLATSLALTVVSLVKGCNCLAARLKTKRPVQAVIASEVEHEEVPLARITSQSEFDHLEIPAYLRRGKELVW